MTLPFPTVSVLAAGCGAVLAAGLAGCHLFVGVEFTCLKGMPCAGVEETAVDTSVEPAPTLGWIVSVIEKDGGEGSGRALAYSAAGEPLKEWPGLGEAFEGVTPSNEARYHGAVSYNPDNGAGILGYGGYFVTLNYDGTVPRAAPVQGGDVFDVEIRYGGAWFAVGSQVYDYVFDPGAFTPMFGGALESATGLAYADGLLYISACGDGTPDLWVLDEQGKEVVRLRDFDTNCGRGDNVFAGPEGEAWQCNSAGALYRMSDVAAGDIEPAYTAAGFSEVRDCAYDAGDQSFLLFDGTRGLFRFKDGILTRLWEPSDAQRGGRAGFFPSAG